jgi:hypothetical protein
VQSAWKALDIAREPISLGVEQPCWFDAARVLSQPLLEGGHAALPRLAGNEIGFLRDQGIQLRDQVAGRLMIDEPEAQEDRKGNHTKYLKGPFEKRPLHQSGTAHGTASWPRRSIVSGPRPSDSAAQQSMCLWTGSSQVIFLPLLSCGFKILWTCFRAGEGFGQLAAGCEAKPGAEAAQTAVRCGELKNIVGACLPHCRSP